MKIFTATRRGPRSRRAINDKFANDNAAAAAGRKNARDEGTPELRRMRIVLADGADPVACGHPLALLLAKGLIAPPQHQAGLRFGTLYRLAIGRAVISYRRLYEGLAGESGAGRSPLGEREMAYARARYLAVRAALESEGPAVLRDTENLIVFGAWPAVLLCPKPANENLAPGHAAHLIRLRRGLDALDRGLK